MQSYATPSTAPLRIVDRQTFREHPERIKRFSSAEASANGRKGGQRNSAGRITGANRRHVEATMRCLIGNVAAPEWLWLKVYSACLKVAAASYERGYTAGHRAKARRTARPVAC